MLLRDLCVCVRVFIILHHRTLVLFQVLSGLSFRNSNKNVYCIIRSSFCEGNSYSGGKEISFPLWNENIRYRIHRCAPLQKAEFILNLTPFVCNKPCNTEMFRNLQRLGFCEPPGLVVPRLYGKLVAFTVLSTAKVGLLAEKPAIVSVLTHI
jgi:hypothetical protein